MKWSNYDKSQITNLVIALKKAKFEMTGMEIVAFADVFKWVSALHDHIEQELLPKPPTILSPAAVKLPDAPSNPLDAPKDVPAEEPVKVERKKRK